MLPLKDQAIKCALNNNWTEAIHVNQSILEQNPKDIDAMNRLGYSYLKYQDFKKSKEIRIKSKIARKLLRNAFDDIEVTDEAKGYGKIEMGTIKVGDKNAEVVGIVDEDGSHFELKEE